jgi:hypothetical protein
MYDDDDEEPTESVCPYCAETDPCEHVLLVLDVTFRCAEGGELDDSFSSAWAAIYDLYPDGDVEEDEEMDALLDIVIGLSDFESEHYFDGGPGTSSKYQVFYCSSRERVQSGVANFAVQVEGYLKNHKLAPKL